MKPFPKVWHTEMFTITVAGGPETFALSMTPSSEPTLMWYPADTFPKGYGQGSPVGGSFTWNDAQSVTIAADARLAVGDRVEFGWHLAGPTAPTANFTASTSTGSAPLSVSFTDTSTDTPTSWAWTFGDGGTSTEQNPTHEYATTGTFTVSLTATNATGSDVETKVDLITVTGLGSQPDAWNPATMLGADLLHPNNTGMTYLADAYEWALGNAGITSLTGQTITAYGDSWTASDSESTPGQRAIQQLISRLGGTLTNQAVDGYRIGDAAGRAIGTAGTFTPGSADLVVAAIGLNDCLLTDTAQQRTASLNYLRALFAVLCAAERIEQTAFTFGGTWANTANPNALFSGGSNAVTTSEGATATYTITTAGTYYLLTQGTDGSLKGGVLTITQGATTLATLDLNAQETDTGVTLTADYGPLSVRLDGVVAGTLTVTYSKAGRTGTVNGFIDALVRVSATPPDILAVKPVEVLAAGHNKPALLDYIRDQYDTLAAEFGANVIVCDPDPSWTP